MKRTAVVPLDGSENSEGCLSILGILAAAHDVEVELVIVKELADERAGHEELQSYVDAKAREMRELFGLDTRGIVKEGVPYPSVIEETRRDKTAVVILSTTGRGQLESSRVGSVADSIIRSAGCPALVVGPDCGSFATDVDRVIVPLDGSKFSEAVLTIVGPLAQSLHAVVELVRVVESDEQGEVAGASAYLAETAKRLPPVTRLEEVVKLGPVADTLLEEIGSHPRSIVVMSSHGGDGFRSYALGSVTSRMLLGPAPVLVVVPGQADRLAGVF